LKIYLLIIAVLLGACNSIPNQKEEVTSVTNQNGEVPISKKIYFFQHEILPEWTFTTDGKFYADLLKGDLAHLKMAATEIISNDYANGISSEVINDNGAILIKFPKPKAMTNCFFVLILKNKAEFSFYTYEKTMNFGGDDPVIGVVGSWSPEGNHANLGGRTYSNSSDFVSDILRKND
jgi:hypothetical protein